MCDPATLTLAGLKTVATFAAIDAQNDRAGRNFASAAAAGNREIETTQQQFIEQNRSLIQGGFDQVLAGRAAEAEAYTSAIENGVQGASVRAMLRDRKLAAQRGETRTVQEIDSLSGRVDNQFKNIGVKTAGRINSVSTTRFGFGDAAGILAPIVRTQVD